MREIAKLAEGQCLTDFSASTRLTGTPHIPKSLKLIRKKLDVCVFILCTCKSVCVCLNSWPETLLYVLNG